MLGIQPYRCDIKNSVQKKLFQKTSNLQNNQVISKDSYAKNIAFTGVKPQTIIQKSLKIRNYVEKSIIPRYLEFDKAHNVEHVNTVIEESLNLAQHFDVNKDMVYVVAAYHDLGLCKDRETHHLISGEILLKDKNIKKWFSKPEIQTMKEAIEDHRASAKNPPRSIYGKIVSEADRSIDPMDIIKRTLQFSMKHNPTADKQFYYKEVLDHLIDKYSEKGYITLWLKESKNSENLEKLRQIIKDEQKLKEIFEQLHAKEAKQ